MNTSELKASIARAGMTFTALADRLGISQNAFCNKMYGRTEFKGSEIKALAMCLGLTMNDVNDIFFESSVT